MFNFKNKVVIVTGGGSGMGLSTAKKFSAAGASVMSADLNDPKEEAAELVRNGFKAVSMQCDVAKEEDAQAMVERTVDAFSGLDAAYNNAGIQSPVADTAVADGNELDHVLAVNLRGLWNCMKYELQQMQRQNGGGTIVNCSSMGGLIGPPGRSAYHASKHGVLGLTKSSTLEYAARNIRINAVCPRVLETPMVDRMMQNEAEITNGYLKNIPSGRLGRPEEVRDVVLWLCRPASTYVIGQAISVDGGYTIH